MGRLRHVIEVPGYDLPGHLARTLCGRRVAYARQPNVPRSDPRMCGRCRALDEAERRLFLVSNAEKAAGAPGRRNGV